MNIFILTGAFLLALSIPENEQVTWGIVFIVGGIAVNWVSDAFKDD